MRLQNVPVLLAFMSAVGLGQTPAAIVGGGYSATAPLTVAPGQLITIFVTGIGTSITQRIAATAYPLPIKLGGISVSLTQMYPPERVDVPILAVFSQQACSGLSSCPKLLGITVQIPFELVPNTPGMLALPNVADIAASEGSTTAGPIQLNPVTNNVHVLRYGDFIALGSSGRPLVTHADGTLVSRESPAKIGEVLVLYAVGLGKLDQRVRTGATSPSPPTSVQWPLVFDYRPDATPSAMRLDPQANESPGPIIQGSSLFAGLVPGYGGLYQMNFQVPPPQGPLQSCDNVRSNLTVNLIGENDQFVNSFDGAAICVDTEPRAANRITQIRTPTLR